MKNLTIGKRLGLTIGAILIILIGVGIFAEVQLRETLADAREIDSENVPTVEALVTVLEVASENYGLVYKHISSSTEKDMVQLEQLMAAGAERSGKAIADLEKLIVLPAGKQLLAQAAAARQAYVDVRAEVLAASRVATNSESVAAVYARARTELDPKMQVYTTAIGDLYKDEVRQLNAAADEIVTVTRKATVVLLVALVVAVGIGCAAGFWNVRKVNAQLLDSTKVLAQGADQVAAAANELSATSQSLAEGASEQAASLEETSASLEEISSMTKRSAESAANGKALSQQARESADTGAERVEGLNQTLTAIKGAIADMQTAVAESQSSSEEIAKIIKTIDEIAFQTNLLALNAAVEAARAGEAGAGFAVVADEVRSLAQRSAQAAKDTADKIAAAVRRSQLGGEASSKVVRSLGEVENSAKAIEQAFTGIAAQVKSLDSVIAEIAGASQEQSQGIGEVNMSVSQMDKVTQSNAASAEENAASSEELNAQAATLQDVVGQLQLLVTGQRSTTTLPAIAKRKPTPGRLATSPAKPPGKLVPGDNVKSALAFQTGAQTPVSATPEAAFKDF